MEASTVVSALTTAVGSIATEATSAIAAVLPSAATVMGSGLVIALGIKAFRKVAK